MQTYTTGRTVMLCLGAMYCAHISAQHSHQAVPTSASMDFEAVYRAALAIAPEAPAGVVRLQLADDYAALGRRWINNRPSWETVYLDDGLLDNSGRREMEAGITVDLWRPGERAAAQALGSNYARKANAWQQHFELLVAGRVRSTLADLAHAETLLLLEQRSTQEAERLLAITSDLFAAGSVPELDVLQTRSLLLEQRKTELEAEAALVDAERSYRVITGLDLRPASAHREPLSPLDEIETTHPYLQLLQAEIDLAESNIDRIRREALGSPSMTLGVRRERGIRQDPYNDSFGVTFSVPFGGAASVSAPVSLARSNKVDAEIEYSRTYQLLNATLHEIEHELFLVEESLELSREQAELSERQWQMSRAAFTAGEIDLAPVVIALQRTLSSTRTHELLLLQQQRLITEFNQAIGVLP